MTAVACPFCGAEHTAGTYVCPVTNRRLQGLLPVDTIIDGKYRIDGIIGVGGMGVVYRAEHSKIARQVALKMLLPEYIVYPDLVARVEREARTAGQIDHPNVVSIVDLGTTPEHGPYIAMELLRGQELATTVEKAGGRLDAAEAVDIMRQVLAGLEAAHKRGVIHRDLKPENIFLTAQEDGSRTIKVLDFGISKLRDDTQLSSLTRTGTVMGTPQFMAPEQAAGARDQDVRIDLYAAGAVLYAVLCNGLPYEAENYNLLINEILNKSPIPIQSRNATLDPRLATIVMKAISKKPEARFQTARAMSEALTHWHDNRNSPSPSHSRVHTAPMPAARGRNSGASHAVSARVSPAPQGSSRLSAGGREYGRRESTAAAYSTQAITAFDEELSPDDPNFVDHNEATIVVPTMSSDEYDDEFDGDIEEIDAQPSTRSGRPSAPSQPENNALAALHDSPLDAPPIVLPTAPKPPPSDESWAKLRTDHPSMPPDPWMEEATRPRPTRVWPYVALFMLVSAAGALVAIHRFSPPAWDRITAFIGLRAATPPAPPPPVVPLPEVDASAPHMAPDPVGDASAPVDVVPAIAAPLDATPATSSDVAPEATVEAVAPAAHNSRHHRHRNDG